MKYRDERSPDDRICTSVQVLLLGKFVMSLFDTLLHASVQKMKY